MTTETIGLTDHQLDPDYIADQIGVPLWRWEGNCHAIATMILEINLVSGHTEYGLFYGTGEMVRHRWIYMPDGRIYDPARWTIEGAEPYIWVGHDTAGHYDLGANRAREILTRGEPPENDPKQAKHELANIPPAVVEFIQNELQLPKSVVAPKMTSVRLSTQQLFYLANTPIHRFPSDRVRDWIYGVICEEGHQAFIPIDNQKRAGLECDT
jgi:hypothetical protein